MVSIAVTMADRQNVLMGVTPDVVEAAHILVMMKHGMKAFIEAQNSCHRFPYLYYASLNPTISAQLHYFASHGFPFNSPFYDFSAAPSTYQLPLVHAHSFTIPPQDAYCGMLTASKCIVGPPRDHCPSGEAPGDGNADQETTQPGESQFDTPLQLYRLKIPPLQAPSLPLWYTPESLDPIHKWRLFYFCSVIVQISLPSLALEREFFSI